MSPLFFKKKSRLEAKKWVSGTKVIFPVKLFRKIWKKEIIKIERNIILFLFKKIFIIFFFQNPAIQIYLSKTSSEIPMTQMNIPRYWCVSNSSFKNK